MTSRFYNNWDFPPNYYEFDPSSLMVEGDGSYWYDFGNWNFMFQDAAMTIPITAAGQPVGAIIDRGPNNYHITQPSGGNRPVTRVDGNGFKYVEFLSANQQYLYTPRTDCAVALGPNMNGYVVGETFDTATFHRFTSIGTASGSDVTATSMAIHSGDANNHFGIRAISATGINPQAPGTGVTPLGIYSYRVTGANSSEAYGPSSSGSDLSHAALGMTSSCIGVGCLISNNAPSIPTGLLNGKLYQLVHIGAAWVSANDTKVRNWINNYRL